MILLNAIIISQPPVFTALRSPSGAAVLHALPPILITPADPATAAPLASLRLHNNNNNSYPGGGRRSWRTFDVSEGPFFFCPVVSYVWLLLQINEDEGP